MMRAARKRMGLATDEITMIGDTIGTNIGEATDLGFRSVESIAQLLPLAAVTV